MMISMRAPEFWWQPRPNIAARLLAPLGWIYGAVTMWRMVQRGQRIELPIFCIGNFVAGGAGKTPTAIAIAERLLAKGERPVFLTRGYRGKIAPMPCLVDALRHSAEDVGDEALLLARLAPTIIGGDRLASAQLARQMDASCLILDDGLQNPTLTHDLRLAVVDAKTGIGNGLCIPSGPLRAPISGQLTKVSALLFIGTAAGAAALRELAKASGKPIFGAKLVAKPEINASLRGQKVFAFAGIGLPEKLRATLEGLGADVVGWQAFADHHRYSLKVLQRLQGKAADLKACLVTTEKDLVRIAPLLAKLDKKMPMPVALPVTLVFDDEGLLDQLLDETLASSCRFRI
jgi:tetraacyldisaccharide 4'-kinase